MNCLHCRGRGLRSTDVLAPSSDQSFPPQNLLSDERLYQSEALYAFLSPSPDYLKAIDVQGKKSTFSLSSFLERLPRDFFSHQEVSYAIVGGRKQVSC